MSRRSSWLRALLLIALPLLPTCTGGESPFQPKDSKINLFVRNSNGIQDTASVTDTVEKTVRVGMTTYLPSYITKVSVTIVKAGSDTDTTLIFQDPVAWPDTQWIKIAFHSIGTRTVSVITTIQDAMNKSVYAQIIVAGKPILVIDPVSTSTKEDSSALFFVKASGVGQSFFYQWYKDASLISNATDDTLIINSALMTNTGRYSCVIKDQWGDSVTSASALLSVIQNTEANHKPLLAVTGTKNVTPGQLCRLTLSATDPDAGQTFVYKVVNGPTVDSLADTIFLWTPPNGFIGSDTVVFSVTDNGTPALSDTQKVVITVTSQVSVAAKVQGLKPLSRIGGYFAFIWNKVGNADSYAIYRSSDKAAFTAIAQTADTLADDSTHSLNYYYFVTAKNSAGSSPSSDTIYSGDINVKPQWKHSPITVNVKEGSPLTLSLSDSCTDPNGDAVAFSLVPGGPTGDTILGGTIYGYAPGYNDSGLYFVRVIGTDGKLSDTLTMNLHVINQNRPPVFDADKPKTSYAIKAGAQLSFGVSATDPDGDLVTYAIKSSTLPRTLPALNAGIITWQSVLSDSGLFNIALMAKDASDSTSVTVQVAVGKANAPPSVSIVGLTKGQRVFVREADTLRFTVGISDPESATEKLSLRLADLSPFACGTTQSFDSTSGLFVFVPSYNCAIKDTFLIPSVQFIGTDNASPALSDTFTISIGVINKNRPPVMFTLHDTTINENQLLSFKVSAVDPDSNSVLTHSAAGVPSWATFTAATGVFTGTPNIDQAGTYIVKFTTTDNGTPPLSDSGSMTIIVTNRNRPPQITPKITNKSVNASSSLTFTVVATDPDGSVPVLTATGLDGTPIPLGAAFNAVTGFFSWTPGLSQAGLCQILFTASDGDLSDVDTVSITVNYTIGQTYGGGTIFYVDETGLHGLIAAPSSYETATDWGCVSATIPGTDSVVGSGKSNTVKILSGCSTVGIAARLCSELLVGGNTDWYLPSKDELNLMYLQKDVISATLTYWSSTEASDNTYLAWMQNFSNGLKDKLVKATTASVRPIRSF